ITPLTAAVSVLIPRAARVARNDALTASPSSTAVPARSKTTSSIMVCSQPVRHDLFGQTERKGHPGPADTGHGQHLWAEVGDDVRGRGVIYVGPVPAGGDGQVRDRQEGPQVGED